MDTMRHDQFSIGTHEQRLLAFSEVPKGGPKAVPKMSDSEAKEIRAKLEQNLKAAGVDEVVRKHILDAVQFSNKTNEECRQMLQNSVGIVYGRPPVPATPEAREKRLAEINAALTGIATVAGHPPVVTLTPRPTPKEAPGETMQRGWKRIQTFRAIRTPSDLQHEECILDLMEMGINARGLDLKTCRMDDLQMMDARYAGLAKMQATILRFLMAFGLRKPPVAPGIAPKTTTPKGPGSAPSLESAPENATPLDRSRIDGGNALLTAGAVNEGGTVYGATPHLGAPAPTQLTFRFRENRWEGSMSGSPFMRVADAAEAMQKLAKAPMPKTLPDGVTNEEIQENRKKWTVAVTQLIALDQAAEKYLAFTESVTKTKDAATAQVGRVEAAVKEYTTKIGSPITNALAGRIDEQKKIVTSLTTSATMLTPEQVKQLVAATQALDKLYGETREATREGIVDKNKKARYEQGRKAVLDPSSYGSGINSGHIYSNGTDTWYVDIDGYFRAVDYLAVRWNNTDKVWETATAANMSGVNSSWYAVNGSNPNWSSSSIGNDSGRTQANRLIDNLKAKMNDLPITGIRLDGE